MPPWGGHIEIATISALAGLDEKLWDCNDLGGVASALIKLTN